MLKVQIWIWGKNLLTAEGVAGVTDVRDRAATWTLTRTEAADGALAVADEGDPHVSVLEEKQRKKGA